MRVLVTGGCGLIGFHAAKMYAERGHHVDVIDNLERSDLLGHNVSAERKYFNVNRLHALGVKVHIRDVSDKYAWKFKEKHDYVLHFAGQCGVPTSIRNPRRDMEVNYLGTFNALEYCREVGAAIAFASTNKVYPLHDCFKQEKGKWEFEDPYYSKFGFPEVEGLQGARTPYGASKYAADILCQEWAHTYGVRTGIFRMSCIYGPNQFGFEEQGWATWFIIAKLKGWPITIYGDGHQTRDMLYVEDCVKAYDAFLSSDISSGVYNLGGGVENVLSLHEHLDWVSTHLNITRSDEEYSDWRPLDQKSYVSDIEKIRAELNWKPQVNVYGGLEATCEWVSKHLDLF